MMRIDWDTLLAGLEQQRTGLADELADVDAVIATVRKRANPTATVMRAASRAKPARNGGKVAGRGTGGAGHLNDDQVATMRTQFEAGVPNMQIARQLGVSPKAVYKRAAKAGWKRRPTPIAARSTTADTPKGTQLAGSVKCTNPDCGVMTDYDPCRRCGVTLKRKWR